MSSPRPIAPSSGTPATSVAKRTQRVHWMQRFIEVFTKAPRYLSSTARLFSWKRLESTPYAMAWSCRSHSPPWSQIGQSSGWLISRNSITPSRAFFTIGVLVLISGGSPFGPGRQSRTPQAQLATGLGEPLSSTRHMRQLPAIESRSWKQKRGISAPPASHACSSVYSGGTSISLLSTMSLVMGSLRRFRDRLGMRVGGIFVDAPFDLRAEMPQQALHRPRSAIAKGANGVAFDLRRDFHEHVDLALLRAPVRHAVEHAPHPAHALAARRALAAAFMLVKIGNARHRLHDIVGLVHDDDGGRAERRLLVAAAVEIHQQRVSLIGPGGDQRHRRAAGNDGHQIVPAAAHAAGVALD